MKITIKNIDAAASLITISGKLDIENTPPFEKEMYALLDKKDTTILFNLSQMVFIDSSGVGALIKFMNKAKLANIQIILYNLSEPVQKIFERAYLDRFFLIKNVKELKKQYPQASF